MGNSRKATEESLAKNYCQITCKLWELWGLGKALTVHQGLCEIAFGHSLSLNLT
jgi:hypothetical protein